MAFRFNFPNPDHPSDNDSAINDEAKVEEITEKKEKSEKEHVAEIFLKDNDFDMPDDVTATIHTFGDTEVHCYNSESVEEYLCRKRPESSNFVTAVSAHSDLVPDKYEGLNLYSHFCIFAVISA
ncbi:uncharacterized protein [Argopecten irradians]|uniref:uncharacterized protein n=1 Tax=Argopecten irradians TaxID=31199 RepID=UPI00372293EC